MNRSDTLVMSIFADALACQSAAARVAVLNRACGDDAALRAEIEGLLNAHQEAGDFLKGHGLPINITAASEQPNGEAVGTTIGPYKLLEQIGEGGMGVVYLAEQSAPVRRRVALKIIRPGMDTREVIRRFEAERQALAMMDHPNIAKVHDAGTTENGRPYFVMELVQGVPITEYCDQCNLTTRERLELFMTVCQAVQHAHQKGIIHRDLKPTNVLVAMQDGQPAPKIIDFGVAKAVNQRLTEHTLMTSFVQMIGTPTYMSPEQAELSPLGVDTRSDIYSLGVLLYELLTGTTPIDKDRLHSASYDEMRRIIREEEPPKPSTRISTLAARLATTVAARHRTDPRRHLQTIRGELDWIVMKCLEKDRNRRYESAGSLARDVERYLSDEPVQAFPPSAAYRFTKFVRRNRGPVLAATLLIVALLGGIVATTWQAIRATRAEALATARLDAEMQARQQATAISQLLQEGLESANPDAAKGADYTVRQLLDEIATRMGDQLRDQPAAEAEIHATIGNAYRRLELWDQAAPHLKRALRLREQLFGTDSIELARSLYDEAWNDSYRGDSNGTEARVRRSLEIHRKLGIRDTETVEVLSLLQLILHTQWRFEESEHVGREALAVAREQPDPVPEMANILHRLANTLIFRRDYVEAERLARESVPLHRELHGNRHPETGYGLRILGWCLLKQHKYDEAETCLREALAIFAEQYEHINQGWVGAIEDLVLVLEAKSDKTGLEALRAEVAARARQTLERRPDDTGPLLYAATALVRVGDVDGAADICSHVVSVTPGKLKLPRDSINEIAWLLATHPNPNRRNAELAVELAQQAVESVPRAGFLWNTLGIAHYRAGEWKAAVEMLEKSMELRDGGASSDFFFLAMAHWQLGEKDEAQRWYGQAVEWMDKNKPDNEELRRFRAEAVELLGIAEPKSAEPQPAENKAPKTGNPAPASPPKP